MSISLDAEVVVLGGGTGTPKLINEIADRFTSSVPTVIANTGDDVEFGDLFVTPDVDSCLFAAAGILDTERWWGIEDDTEQTADALRELADSLGLNHEPNYRPTTHQTEGRPIAAWRRFEAIPEFMTFGDRDRAIHRLRTTLLDRGHSLTTVTQRIGDALGAELPILPMSDDPVATLVHTDDGSMHFQEFWVARRGTPTVEEVEFRGSTAATATDAVIQALDADVAVIGPSNPVTSLGPILAVDGIVDHLKEMTVIAVSPFIGARAFSGPAADLMEAVELPVGTPGLTVAYPFADAIVTDVTDTTDLGLPTVQTDLRIETPDDAERVWHGVIQALEEVS